MARKPKKKKKPKKNKNLSREPDWVNVGETKLGISEQVRRLCALRVPRGSVEDDAPGLRRYVGRERVGARSIARAEEGAGRPVLMKNVGGVQVSDASPPQGAHGILRAPLKVVGRVTWAFSRPTMGSTAYLMRAVLPPSLSLCGGRRGFRI